MKQTQKKITLLLFTLFANLGFTQNPVMTKVSLPENICGEWYSNSGKGEYNGVLIHPDFIEYGYRAFMYQEIEKIKDKSYRFVAKDVFGNNLKGEMEVINKDSIQLKRGNMPKLIYVSQDKPKDSKRTTFAEVEEAIKKAWYTTDINNNLEFDVSDGQFIFRNENYSIIETVLFKSNGNNEYRFVVRNNKSYWMFYFKNWSEHYLQVGFNGKMGDLYKANKDYPDARIDNFQEYVTSANGKRYLSNKKGISETPKEVSNWIHNELKKVTTKPIEDFNSPHFFNRANGKLIGYLKGYDTSLGFKTGIIYLGNDLTREDFPIVLKIHSDGRFEADLPLTTPLYSKFVIENKWIPFYIEPGQTLAVTLDIFELLETDRLNTIQNKFKSIEYEGALANVNTELLGFNFKRRDYNNFMNKVTTLKPTEFKDEQLTILKENLDQLNNYINTQATTPQKHFEAKTTHVETITSKAASLLKNTILLESATALFDFEMYRKYEARKDTTNNTLKSSVKNEYYDFLQSIPLNDQSLLVVDEFGTFINRFEYCEPFSASYKRTNSIRPKPKKNILDFFKEEGIILSQAEKEVYEVIVNDPKKSTPKFLEENKEILTAIHEKYKEEIKLYSEKYIKPLYKNKAHVSALEQWKTKDSILSHDLVLQNNLVYEVAKIRSLNFDLKRFDKASATTYWDELKTQIQHPFLIEEGDRIYNKVFPDNNSSTYTLPDGEASDIFKKIIDPFKGKIIFVDFWATSCGPCVAGIKRMKETRKKYEGNKDFEFVFITDERSSPLGRYTDFVKEQELKNIYRLPLDKYNYLRQLFKFNGIPRYVVIDKKGNVINDNFAMHNFTYELNGILKEHNM
ncbi:TlpA disulfide reductase family protein [Snuella lapsa]|uniref:Thioredoxin domain-containing protein n=1 Tax=Snuella lapsa TaxID=870481 RepID=A0ABP6Y8D4_9FLAO